MRELMIVAMFLVGCGYSVDEGEAVHAVEAMGFRDAQVIDRNVMLSEWHGCARGDSVGFEVSATNPVGKRARLMVCCGAGFKACTVRVK